MSPPLVALRPRSRRSALSRGSRWLSIFGVLLAAMLVLPSAASAQETYDVLASPDPTRAGGIPLEGAILSGISH